MLGTFVNVGAIILGSLLGVVLKGGIPEKINDTIIKGVGLCVFLIGASGALEGMSFIVPMIFFIVIGSALGEWVDIERHLEAFGNRIEKHYAREGSSFSKGFVTASLLYCVGAMAIMGALDSGIHNNHEILYAKSVLDGVISIVLASTLGIGVLFSAGAVLLYQGSITLLAGYLSPYLTDVVIAQMSATGSVLILGLGLGMIGAAKIKVGNMLPAVLIPILYHLIHLLRI